MSGNRAQGRAAARTIKAKYGEDFYVKLGSKGGQAPHAKRGFQLMDRAKHAEASRRGGTISRPRRIV